MINNVIKLPGVLGLKPVLNYKQLTKMIAPKRYDPLVEHNARKFACVHPLAVALTNTHTKPFQSGAMLLLNIRFVYLIVNF